LQASLGASRERTTRFTLTSLQYLSPDMNRITATAPRALPSWISLATRSCVLSNVSTTPRGWTAPADPRRTVSTGYLAVFSRSALVPATAGHVLRHLVFARPGVGNAGLLARSMVTKKKKAEREEQLQYLPGNPQHLLPL